MRFIQKTVRGASRYGKRRCRRDIVTSTNSAYEPVRENVELFNVTQYPFCVATGPFASGSGPTPISQRESVPKNPSEKVKSAVGLYCGLFPIRFSYWIPITRTWTAS